MFPTTSELMQDVLIRGAGYGMLLPQPCEYAEEEKGATHSFRLVAPVFPFDRGAGVGPALIHRGARTRVELAGAYPRGNPLREHAEVSAGPTVCGRDGDGPG